MLKTARKISKIIRIRPKAQVTPEPKAEQDQGVPGRLYRYQVIQTRIANGEVYQMSAKDVRKVAKEAIEADGEVCFDSHTIEIKVIPVCFTCCKDTDLNKMGPYGDCESCEIIRVADIEAYFRNLELEKSGNKSS